MRFTLKNPRSLQYIDYQNVRKTEFLGCQSQEECLSAVISTVSVVVLGFSARFNRSPGHHVPVVRTHPAAFSDVLYPGVADANFVI